MRKLLQDLAQIGYLKGPMRGLGPIILFFALIVVCPFASALEADQYTIWKTPAMGIQDSTHVLNEILDQKLTKLLTGKKLRGKKYQGQDKCLLVAHKYMGSIRPHFFKNDIKTHLVKKLDNAAYPKKQSLFKDYKNSMYAGFIWPFVMPVSQTVKINGVFLGTDKVDHFFASGRRYLNAYRREREKGSSKLEGIKRAIKYGVSWPEETGFLGFWSSGAFSFADLESNFQGMNFGIDMCEGDDPVLKYDESSESWQALRGVRIQDYVNPLWDEAFNNSYFIRARWKRVKRYMQEEYCELAQKPEVQKLWKSYHKKLENYGTPFHVEYVRGLIIIGRAPNPTEQSLHKACEFPSGVMEGPKFWQIPYISLMVPGFEHSKNK